MVLSKEDRIQLLEKARAVKASKKAEKDANKIPPKKGRPKKQTKTLNLDDVADETNVEEVANDLKNMDIKADDIKADDIKADDIKEESTKEKTKLQEDKQEQDDVQIIEEVVKKPKKKKKIIRRYIEPSSSSEEEVVEEYIKAKKKLKEPKAPRYHPYPKQEPEPIQLTPPTLNLFCY